MNQSAEAAGQWHVATSLAPGNEWQLYAPQCGSWATDGLIMAEVSKRFLLWENVNVAERCE